MAVCPGVANIQKMTTKKWAVGRLRIVRPYNYSVEAVKA